MTRDERERMEELLVLRVTGEITPEDERELAQLVIREHGADPSSWEHAAGELTAALLHDTGVEETMPPHLARAVISHGESVVRGAALAPPPDVVDIATRRRPGVLGWTGWVVAAAAVLALVLLPGRGGDVAQPVTATALRDSLVSTDGGALQLAWSPTEDVAAEGASGGVVWSAREQAGVMRIRGLAPNDPTETQYQLWIFDATRDERFPVDGGVFDIPAGEDEVFVPIDARLPVNQASLFAITVEPPGGVVVSDRERIVLVAQVGP